jgi:hypothetical protein
MAAKRVSGNPALVPAKVQAPRWNRLLLALTLLPLASGVLLIVAWSFDFIIWISPDFQISIASLFILLSFAASNLVQKNWLLAGGWLLFAMADWLLLNRIDTPSQVTGIILGAAGLLVIGYEIYRRTKQGNSQQQRGKKK